MMLSCFPTVKSVIHFANCHHAAAHNIHCADVSALSFWVALRNLVFIQVGVVGSGQGMTDYKKVARHDFNPDAE